MNSTDYLRGYTAPRVWLLGLLFLSAVLFRVAAVAVAVVVHTFDRCADRLLAWGDQLPPARVRVMTTTRR